MTMLAFIPALLFGVAAAVQSPTNASLAQKAGSTQATLISFTGGLALLCLLVPAIGQGDLPAAFTLPKWQLVGGLYGAATIYGLTKVIPYLGAALSTTILVLGELCMSMMIDANGWLTMQQLPMSIWRIVGAIVLAAGIFLVYLGKRDGTVARRNDGARLALCAAFTFALGFLAALQAPTNAVLSQTVGYIEASFINFLVAWVIILAMTMVKGRGRFASMKGVRPWELLGGFYGVVGVISTAIATSFLGAGLMVASGTFAQLAASLLIDGKGWLGCSKVATNRYRVIGVAVIAIGILLTAAGKVL